eukprot:GFKZ01009668.1.p1 GENE.GFKZ01009668.1~~GFKZ01009668.1.p1  ORF type:complete len:702 (+),score=68.44 GFKZ01009668.1:324-2429(+)
MPLRHPPSQSFDDVVVIDSPSPCLPSRSLPNPITFHRDPTEVIDLDKTPSPALDDHLAPRKRRRRDHSSPDSSQIPAVIDVDAVDDSPPPGPSNRTRRQASSHRPISRDPTVSQPSDRVVPPPQAVTRRDSAMSDEVIETAASGPRLSAQPPSLPVTTAPSHDLDRVTTVDQESQETPSVEIVDAPPRSSNPPPSNQRARRSMPSLAPNDRIPSVNSSIEPIDGHFRSGNSSPHVVSDTSTPRPSSSRLRNPLGSNRLIQPYIISAVPHSLSGPDDSNSGRRSTRRVIVPFYQIRGSAAAGTATAFTGLRSGPRGMPGPSQRGSDNRFAPMEEIEFLLRESIDPTPAPPQSAVGQPSNVPGESVAQAASGRRLRHDPEVEIMETSARRSLNVGPQAVPPPIAAFSIGGPSRRMGSRATSTPQAASTSQEVHVELPSTTSPTFVVGHAGNATEGGSTRSRLRPRSSSARRAAADVRSIMHEMQQQIQEMRQQLPVLGESYRRRTGGASSRNDGRYGNGRGSPGAGPSTGVTSGVYYPVTSIHPVRSIQNRRRNGRSSATAPGGSRAIRLGPHIHQVLFRDHRHVHPEMHLRFFQQFGGDQHLDYENLVRLDEQLLREKNRAEKEQIDSLPVQKATTADKEIRCCICMCDVEVGEELRVLPCNHKYHKSCIDEWLTYNGCCPVCKKRIGPPRSRRRETQRENQ